MSEQQKHGTRANSSRARWLANWLASWARRDSWFLAGVLLVVLISLAGLSAGAGIVQGRANVNAAAPSPGATSPTATPAGNPLISARPANERVFPLDYASAGLMMPSVDQHGNVWVGEMDTNRLARLDTHSGQMSEWAPPDGNYGIMQTVADGNGRIWFTEQSANYIGRFDPATATFATFPLGDFGGKHFGPQDLVFDSHGMLWFTGLEAGRIGRLDPATGVIKSWPVPGLPGQSSLPYSLAIAPDGQVWFGELEGTVGRLDPTTGATRLFPLADPKEVIFSMTSDSHGTLWFTELSDGHLGRIDPARQTVSELTVPKLLGAPTGMYQVVEGKNGVIWFACAGINALVRYEPERGAYTFYQLHAPQSIPYGLARDDAGNLWLTADGQPNYIAKVVG